jgi:hypothetical protein
MKNDEFFIKEFCDRCGNGLIARTMSWFTTETICIPCAGDERNIRRCLPNMGKDFEDCGYIPKTVGEADINQKEQILKQKNQIQFLKWKEKN